jgi:glucosamine-6-phosphate deaminase
LEVIIAADRVAVGRLVAEAIAALISRKPRSLLGLATGSTMLPIYHGLQEQVREQRLSLEQCRFCLLDEYIGLPRNHPQSYWTFVQREVIDRLGLSSDSVMYPDASARDLPLACANYEREISEAKGVDLQLLGLGRDGHIGFNEPCSSLASRTRVKTLTAQTRADNARFFPASENVPHHVITQGIGTILEARHLVLVAIGSAKADAVRLTVEGPVSSFIPASALQLHPHATVVIDQAAASKLSLREYFLEAYRLKPNWQCI